jgi:hypothetical protein
MGSHKYITNQGPHVSHTRGPISRPVAFVANIVAQCLCLTASGSSAPSRIDGLTEGSVMGEHPVRVQEESGEEQGQ